LIFIVAYLALTKRNSSDSSSNSSLKSAKVQHSFGCGLPKKKFPNSLAMDDERYTRSRCYTDPGEKPSIPKPTIVIEPTGSSSASSSPQCKRKHYPIGNGKKALGSLIKQTLKVTSASVGLKPSVSDER